MVTKTSTELLADLYDPGKTGTWAVFNRRYRPIVVHFARRCGLQEADAQDIAQETMVEFLRSYRAGLYDRARGSRLRDWLKGIARNRLREFSRRQAKARERQAIASDSRTDFLARVPDQAAFDEWDREWAGHVLSLGLRIVRSEFDDKTYRAFELYAVRQHGADETAKELGVSRNAVYIA